MAPISWIKVFLITTTLLLTVLSTLWWITLPRLQPTKPSSKKLPSPSWRKPLPPHQQS